MRQIANGRALLLWPPVALAAMVVLGLAVGKSSTGLDEWFHQFRRSPARELLVFTDPRLLTVVLAVGVAVALYLRRWRLALVMVASPAIGIVLAQLLKELFGRENDGAFAYPSGHTTAAVVVMGMIVLVAGGAVVGCARRVVFSAACDDRSRRDVPLLHRHASAVSCWAPPWCVSPRWSSNLTGVNPSATQITPVAKLRP